MTLPPRYTRLLEPLPIAPWLKAAPQPIRMVDAGKAQAKEAARGRKATPPSGNRAASEASPSEGEADGAGGSAEKGGAAAAKAGGRKRAARQAPVGSGGVVKKAKGGGEAVPPAAGSPSTPDVEEIDPPPPAACSRRRANRGDEEFDREVHLALMATAAEAEARQRKALGAAAAAPHQPAAATALTRLKAGLFPGRGKKPPADAGASSSIDHRLADGSRVSSEGVAVWAEVYCGSAEAGRWVHVDVVGGNLDKPESVTELQPKQGRIAPCPVTYVVACGPLPSPAAAVSRGKAAMREAKDVTGRYVGSLFAVKKLRDGPWWEATLARLSGAAAAAGSVSGQRPTAAGPASAAAPAAGTSASHRAAADSSLVAADAAAAHEALQLQQSLRSSREDKELNQRSSSGLRDLPTTIDGFKSHPLYILKRHLTKHQVHEGKGCLQLHGCRYLWKARRGQLRRG